MTRIFHLFCFSLFCFYPFVVIGASWYERSAGAAPLSPEELVGETLYYDVQFLWFDRLAEGRLQFCRGESPGTYVAVLEAQTLGVAGWLTSYQRQRFESVMEQTPSGMLRSLTHRKWVVRGSGSDRKEKGRSYVFDHQNRQVHYQRYYYGEVTKDKWIPLEADEPYNDMVTNFINFRLGYFGAVTPSGRYRMPVFSHRGASFIELQNLAEGKRQDLFADFFPAAGLLTRARVDEEVFDTRVGGLYAWFDPQGRPARGVVEDVIGLGDVRGVLRRSEQQPQCKGDD